MWFLSPGTFRYNTGGVIGEKKRNADFLRFGKNLCFSENLGFSRQTSGFPSNPTNSSVSVSLGIYILYVYIIVYIIMCIYIIIYILIRIYKRKTSKNYIFQQTCLPANATFDPPR